MIFKKVEISDLCKIYGDYIYKDNKFKNLLNEDKIYLDEKNNYVIVKKESKDEYKIYYNYKFDLINEIEDLINKLQFDKCLGKFYIYDYKDKIQNDILEENHLKFYKKVKEQMIDISQDEGLYKKDYYIYIYTFEIK